MTQNDYRDDDQTTGQCPKCGRDLGHLTVGLRGWCEQHGWTFADFRSYGDPGDETDDDET